MKKKLVNFLPCELLDILLAVQLLSSYSSVFQELCLLYSGLLTDIIILVVCNYVIINNVIIIMINQFTTISIPLSPQDLFKALDSFIQICLSTTFKLAIFIFGMLNCFMFIYYYDNFCFDIIFCLQLVIMNFRVLY